jgi:hypothetical protein
MAKDPGNQLLWKQRLRRVEAEVVRDAILAAAGRLDRTMGGAPVPIQPQKDGKVIVKGAGADRRSIYLLSRRNYQPTLLALFDQPVLATNCTRRTTSAVPPQALALLNDDWVIEQAGHFAGRVLAVPAGRRVELAFRIAFARAPSVQERQWSMGLVGRQEGRYKAAGRTAAEAERLAWGQLCQMLLCASEFLYVE